MEWSFVAKKVKYLSFSIKLKGFTNIFREIKVQYSVFLDLLTNAIAFWKAPETEQEFFLQILKTFWNQK